MCMTPNCSGAAKANSYTPKSRAGSSGSQPKFAASSKSGSGSASNVFGKPSVRMSMISKKK